MEAKIQLVQETCCYQGCFIVFWLEQEHYKHLQSTKEWFYCPNGHRQHYIGESDWSKARRLEGENDYKDKVIKQKEIEIERLKKLTIKKRPGRPRK